MTTGTNDILPARSPATNKSPVEEKNTQIGDWAIHSWGSSRFPGMAAISAIATLQLSATLSDTPADKLAMDKAAEYLTKALAPQIKSFQEASAAPKPLPKLR
jgi:hypothetical protein